MPMFNPTLIGAPSPAGRGGSGGSVGLGSILYAESAPDSTYKLCDGSQADVAANFPQALFPKLYTSSKQTFNGFSGCSGGIAYGNGIWVASNGSSSTVQVSTDDALNWTTQPTVSGTNVGISYVMFVNGYFFLLGSNFFAYSLNGTAWTVVNNGINPGQLYGAAYANGLWCLAGNNGVVVGANLTSMTYYGTGRIDGIIGWGNYFIAMLIDGNGVMMCAYSTNGYTYTNFLNFGVDASYIGSICLDGFGNFGVAGGGYTAILNGIDGAQSGKLINNSPNFNGQPGYRNYMNCLNGVSIFANNNSNQAGANWLYQHTDPANATNYQSWPGFNIGANPYFAPHTCSPTKIIIPTNAGATPVVLPGAKTTILLPTISKKRSPKGVALNAYMKVSA